MKPLIVGIDPGTTTGFALLDIYGTIVYVGSYRDLGLDALVQKISTYGTALCVGTDKGKTPSFTRRFSAKTGSMVIFPHADLKISQKKELVGSLKLKDAHQFDALASALMAYQKLRPTLQKIIAFTKSLELQEGLALLVIGKELSIQHAYELLSGNREEQKIVRQIASSPDFQKQDVLLLSRTFGILRRENALIKKQVQKIQLENTELLTSIKKLQNINRKKLHLQTKKIDTLFSYKESRFQEFLKQVAGREEEIDNLQAQVGRVNLLLSRMPLTYLFKIVPNLGGRFIQELMGTIQPNDMLYVKDINVINKKTIQALAERVKLIVYEGHKITASFPIKALSRDGLTVEQYGDFAFIPRKEIDSKLAQMAHMDDIVSHYQRERKLRSVPQN